MPMMRIIIIIIYFTVSGLIFSSFIHYPDDDYYLTECTFRRVVLSHFIFVYSVSVNVI